MARRNTERREPVTRGTRKCVSRISGFPTLPSGRPSCGWPYALNQVLDRRKLSQADAAKGAGSDAAEGLRAPSPQAGGFFLSNA